MKPIKVNPIEPRYIVRAIAQPGKDLENSDFEFLIQIGDTYYDLCPSKIKINVVTANKITMEAEIDLHDMEIDMPATMVDEEGNTTKARVHLVARHDFPGRMNNSGTVEQHAINSCSDIDKVTADGKEIYAKSILLEANGETDSNSLTVHTLLPKATK